MSTAPRIRGSDLLSFFYCLKLCFLDTFFGLNDTLMWIKRKEKGETSLSSFPMI